MKQLKLKTKIIIPSPAGIKKEVLKYQSVNNIIIAPANTAKSTLVPAWEIPPEKGGKRVKPVPARPSTKLDVNNSSKPILYSKRSKQYTCIKGTKQRTKKRLIISKKYSKKDCRSLIHKER